MSQPVPVFVCWLVLVKIKTTALNKPLAVANTHKMLLWCCCGLVACRKAYRLGKFLQDVNGLRRVRLHGGHLALLELVVYCGEGTYYFLDQFTW